MYQQEHGRGTLGRGAVANQPGTAFANSHFLCFVFFFFFFFFFPSDGSIVVLIGPADRLRVFPKLWCSGRKAFCSFVYEALPEPPCAVTALQ